MRKPIRTRHTTGFAKQLKKSPAKKGAFEKRTRLLLKTPYHPQPCNHALSGRYTGLRSINLTGDWRVIFSIKTTRSRTDITFQAKRTHSQLYG